MSRRSTALATAMLSCAASAALAAPYASGVTEAGGTVSFRLSEDADITIIRDGVASAIPGTQPRGVVMFPRNGAVNYSIVATRNAGAGYTTGTVLQLSNDSNLFNFEQSQGIVVNRNPANGALFGRIYVANTRSSPTVLGRPVTDGIYMLNGDHSETFVQADTARDAGLLGEFVTGGSSSPFRIALDDAGLLYIANWADANGTIYRTDADVTAGANILAGQGSPSPTGAPTSSLNHGSIGGILVTGSSAGGNLVIHEMDEDLGAEGTLNSMWRFDINGSALPYTGIPTMKLNGVLISDATVSAGIITDISRRYDGKLYISQNRSLGNEVGVVVTANDGTTILFNSLTETAALGLDSLPDAGVQDVLRRSMSHDVSPDGRFLAIGRGTAGVLGDVGDTLLVPLLDGIPDLRNTITLASFTNTTSRGEVAFDAAGNLYAFNAGTELMRIFSAGGLSVTRLNSNGTFSSLPEWNASTGGNVNDTTKWLAGVAPNGANQGALFTGAGAVTINVPVTFGNIAFNNAAGFTLSGASAITLQGASPEVRSITGSHTISAPLLLTQSTGFVIDSGTTTASNLQFASAPAQPISVVKGGAGSLAINVMRGETLRINAGQVRILSNGTNAATSKVNRLLLAPGTKLDITNNGFVVDYAPPTAGPEAEPFDTIRALIISGYNGGGVNAWTGNGITTSAGNANTIGIGYAEAAGIFLSFPNTFMGQTVDNTSVVFRETRYGDADLNGTVNLSDFNRLAGNFGVGTVWSQGDFNYDGMVNLTDFNLLAGNFGLSAGPDGPTAQDWAALAAVVPEPSMGMILSGVAASAAMSRRRRRV